MTDPSARYVLALLHLRGVGRRTAVSVVSRYPDEEQLRAASEADLALAVGKRGIGSLVDGLTHAWPGALDWADHHVERHERSGIMLLPFGAPAYPPLLAAVPDPPALLYVLGDASALDALLTVAVVGTRNPTVRGREIARRVARRFAEAGAVVVSGLAKGIDTAGHEGALETGRTVAVLGTAIDKVYPAENKALAGHIERNGALISEYPMDFASRGDAFVDRDRLQAGLSLAVIPVQTGLTGGTQHTIGFAIEARRRLLCPRPADVELDAPENEGIVALIRDGRATAFDAEDLPRILDELSTARATLLAAGGSGLIEPTVASTAAPTRPRKKSRRASAPSGQEHLDWLLPEPEVSIPPALVAGDPAVPAADPPRVHTIDEVIEDLDATLDRVGPNYDETAFDSIVRAWRRRRYPAH